MPTSSESLGRDDFFLAGGGGVLELDWIIAGRSKKGRFSI